MIGIRNKLEEMARLIHKYNTSYYNKNISLVSDSEYDQLYSTYQKLSEAHPEIINKASKQYYENNKETINEKQRLEYAENKEAKRKAVKERVRKHRQKLKEQQQ